MTNSNQHLAYLKLLDIEVWQSRQRFQPKEDIVSTQEVNADRDMAMIPNHPPFVHPASEPSVIAEASQPPWPDHNPMPLVPEGIIVQRPPIPSDLAALDWEGLSQRVTQCNACPLHKTRLNPVFGVGNRQSEWLIVGEAPGADEDQQGEPFVGRAGQLLNAMIVAMKLKRESIYIANILKSRPPDNRDPLPSEVLACEPYLWQQIALLRPKMILCLGRVAAQNLLKTTKPLGQLRGVLHRVDGIPAIVTYHPAYLLRSPSQKSKAWDDLCLAMQIHQAAPL